MEPEQMTLLRQEVEKTFGRKILSSADCRYLSTEVSGHSGCDVSFNTLRRFFNLMKPTHQPSLFTLNVLSNYCGYSSFDDFVTFKQQAQPENIEHQSSGLLNYLILLFKNTEVTNTNDLTYFKLVQQTITYLDQHSYLTDRFQKEIAKTRNGQHFYFEYLVHIDKLSAFYGEGLRYYLYEKRTVESQVFAHSLLCFRSWLTNNHEEVAKHYKAVMQYNVDKSIRSSVCGRFFASQLYYADSAGLDTECVLLKAREFYTKVTPVKDCFSLFYSFELVIAEALILTSHYEEALFYIEEIIIKVRRSTSSYFDEALLETICLFKAIVYAYTGKRSRALELIHEINPYKFCHLSRQYLSIQFLSLKNKLQNRTDTDEQILHLVQETGFNRLLSFWKSSIELINKYA